MGRHSRKSAAPVPDSAPAPAPAAARPDPFGYEDPFAPDPLARDPFAHDPFGDDVFGNGAVRGDTAAHARPADRRPGTGPLGEDDPFAGWPEPTVTHQGYASQDRPGTRPAGHPQQHEPGGARGSRPDSVYGDWRGVPRPRPAAPATPRDSDTPAFGTPAVGFPQVTLTARVPGPDDADRASTGAHPVVPGPLVPGPRRPAEAIPATGPAAAESDAEADTGTDAESAAGPVAEKSGRGHRVRTYTGMAAAAVTTVLAVVVAGQTFLDGGTDDTAAGAPAAAGRERTDAAASRSDGRPTPNGGVAAAPVAPSAAAPAPELTYEQQMALQLPLDAKLAGPGTFDTVPGVAKAPGKGRVVRYRVDIEQGLGLDAQLFAEAVHRTLNDDRSWGHGGTKTFERVPGGQSDFVITLASPGTTGVWCAKSDLDTTVDNVSCDSAQTERVMINAFRWAQGSATFGPQQMLAYRQMLINHEVGHRLGNGHVNCRTPGSLAPIMQQQTKSLNLNGIQCKPNPWVFPGN